MDKLEIGMRFVQNEESNCIKISTDERTGGKIFSLRSFFSYFGKYHKDVQKQKLKVIRQTVINGAPVFVAEIKI